jgi:hypothetical protein
MISDPAIETEKGETLVCESCAAEFTCNAGQETCWCFDVQVSTDDLGVLKENYQRCLCPQCLGKMNLQVGQD